MSKTFFIAIIAGLVIYAIAMTLMFYAQGEILDGMLRCVVTRGTSA